MKIVKQHFHTNKNDTGSLTFLEAMRDIPFMVKRIYYIYDIAKEARRGFHAHKELEQYLICIHGECTILLDDGSEVREVNLNSPSEGLYVGPGMWREMHAFSHGAVLLVLASEYYDENDYIRKYQDFCNYIKEMAKK